MENAPLVTKYLESVAARKPARFYPWILSGLIILYLYSVSVFTTPIFVFVPAVVAGWFYYRLGGFVASILAFIIDLFLFNTYVGKLDWTTFGSLDNGILIGHVFVTVISVGAGYLREVFEGRYRIDRRLSSRERFLTLISMATRNILEMKYPNDTYYHLLTNLTNLFVADYASLTLWDDTRQQVTLVADTTTLAPSPSLTVLQPEEATIITSALESGHILIIENVQQAPYDVIPSLFKGLQLSPQSALVIPLIAKDYKFGAVTLAFNAPRSFDREDIAYFELISSQIAVALKSVQQERKIEKQLKEANALFTIEHALSISQRVGVEPVLQLIVDSARELIERSKHVVLHLLDEEQQLLIPRAVTGFTEPPKSNINMRLGEGIAGQVMATGEVISIEDIRTDPRFLSHAQPAAFRSLIVAPIKSKDRCVGTISIHSDETGAFGLDEINLLGTLGTQAAIAFENAKLLETIRQDYQELNVVYHLTRNLVASLEPDQLLKDAVEFLQRAFEIYQIQIYLQDPKTHQLAARYGAGVVGNQLTEQGYSLPAGTGIVGYVASTGAPFYTNDVDQVVFFVRNPLLLETQSEMALPIKVDGRVLGVMDIQEASSNPISLKQMKLMDAVTQQLAVALQKAILYSELKTSLDQEKTMRSQLMQSERLAVVGRLLASVSHELNNPLQAIQNALFLLKNEEKLSVQGHQDLDVILAETERMASLIGRLRVTYRAPRDDDFRDILLNNIIEDVHALTATYMRHRQIAFEFHPDPELPIVPGIPDQIRQVILNLFMNAIEAMQMEGRLIVQTQSLPDQDQILLTVIDTGSGIAIEILPNIFEPFTTDKNNGTGLGLTIARDIVLQHQGEIQADNNSQGGATFKVWLPIKRQEQK